MIKIEDHKKLDKLIHKYKINKIFSKDMRRYMELILFTKGEYICREGEEFTSIYLFISGKAKVFTTLSNGKSLLLSFCEDFAVLGDLELFHAIGASTNVQIISDTYCIRIPLNKAKEDLVNDVKFLRFACESLSEKLHVSSKKSSVNLLYPLENRLARYILETKEEANINGEEILKFQENLTEIAELLGTSYRHLLRTLNILCNKGVIKKKNTYYEVIDGELLESLSSDVYK
ncbi:cyclic nucleotide-binding domain-containing protein [Clostridium sp. YIM B02551]|uniref:cyclic nucleotide-binding domain-containing protein n=1 Tax=Clostridium sp. YIM B02551 TaxID=2910679 RepID=UPI001EE9BCE5|nr:cyclic nucleotide-binding domain-containing protein [Clostridium sp. YIM B02551]